MPRTTFSHAPGVKRTSRRGVGFLQADNGRFDAITEFDSLKGDKARFVKSIMDHWVDGSDNRPGWYHGFDQESYRHCFVFKWHEKRVNHRLYGFKCHPKPKSERGFLLCILVFHDTKTDATDYTILNRINRILGDQEEVEAVAAEYEEYRGNFKWRN